jgi:hypothetical protein
VMIVNEVTLKVVGKPKPAFMHNTRYALIVVNGEIERIAELPPFGSYRVELRDNEVQYTEVTERTK